MRARPAITGLLGALVLLSAGAAPALALPPGVHVDPGSPASKEYSFPLSVLRGAAGGKKPSQSTSEPLFGVGITRPRPSGGARGSVASRHSLGAGQRRRSRRTARRGASHGRPQRGSSSPAAGQRRGSPPVRATVPPVRATVLASLVRPHSIVPQVGLIALAVLLAAIVLGVGIAVGQRRT